MITDDTLREGLQTPGLAFTIDEKMSLARQISKAGIKRVLVSYPPAHWSEVKVTEMIVRENLFDEIFGLGRTMKEDIDIIYSTGANISLHLPFKIDNFSEIIEAVKYATHKGRLTEVAIVNVSAYSNYEIIKMAKKIEEAGADVIQLPDTTGTASPSKIKNLIEMAKRELKSDIEVHFHNDSGASVVNAISAVEYGADYIDCTVFGIGERNGISDLASVNSILTLNGLNTKISMEELKKLYKMVADLIIRKLGPDFLFRNFPVFGENSSIHTAGTHAVFSDVFQSEKFSVNVYTGRSMINKLLSANQISVQESNLRILTDKVKDLSVAEGRPISVAEIIKLATETSG